MSNLKKHSILILMGMLILVLIPMSFAADVDDNNTTDVIGVNEVDDNDVDLSSTSDSDVLSAKYDYETTPNPNTINYVEGGDNTVTVTVSCDYQYSSAPMYVYINGDGVNNRQVVNGVYGNKASFTYDVSKISSYLQNGENILKFHIDESYLSNDWLTVYQYNPLTVIVGGSSSESYTGIIYVNETGDDNNVGSEQSPVATISKAIELATLESNTEHKIIVNEGTYTLSNAQLSSDINITGKGKVVVAPNGNNYVMYLGGNHNFEINNIIFVNGTYSTSVISMGTTNKKVNINNCSFINNTGYNYIIYSYGQVTINNCNFINNVVKAGSSAGVIYAYSGSLTVSYSNFINNKNTGSSGYGDVAGYSSGSGWDVYYQATISAENNYWGSNNGPASTQIDKDNIEVKKYVKLNVAIDEENIVNGSSYDVNLKFTDKNGNDLSDNMPDLDVSLSSRESATLNPTVVSISKNTATVSYIAPQVESDEISVKYGTTTLTTLPITISIPEVIEINFEDNEGNAGSSINVPVNVTVNGELKTVDITYSFDNGDVQTLTLTDGKGSIILALPDVAGEYNLTVCYDDVEVNKTITVNVVATSLDASDVEVYVNNQGSLSASLTDVDGNAIEGVIVNFKFTDGIELYNVTDASGVATVYLNLAADTYTANISFSGNGKYAGAEKIITVKVIPYDIAINFEDSEGNAGSSITVPVNVTLNGELIGDETVSYVFNNGEVQSLALTGGKGSIVLVLPDVAGEYNLSVSYGDVEVNKTITVNVVATSLDASDVEVYVNNQGSLSASLTDVDGNAIEGVIVNFKFADGIELYNVTDASGVATVYLNLAADTYTANISFSGSGKYAGAEKIVTVKVIPYDIAINFNDDSGVAGTTVNVPVNVTLNGELIGDETVYYVFNNGEVQSLALTGGKGSIVLVLPDVAGEYNLTVSYADVEVNKTVTVKIIPEIKVNTNNPSLGENATITVNMTEKATGNVTIKVGDNAPETVKIDNGIAVLNVPDLAIGEYNVTVTYNGDENYTTITSKTTLTVSKVEISADEALNITSPENSRTPTYSINLPKGATGNFSVSVDGKVIDTKELVNGSASITVPELSAGNHNITVSYSGDTKYAPIEKNTTVSISEPVVKISENKNINVLYSASASYKVLITKDGKAVGAGESVTFNFNGKNTVVKTDSNGYATLKLNTEVKVKKYTITATYNGVTVKNTVKVNNIIKASNKKVKKSKKVTKVKVTLKKVNGKYLKKAKITIKFKGKKYKIKTNKKGVATWKVKKSMLKKLKVGKKYKYTVTYGKDVVTKKLTIKR